MYASEFIEEGDYYKGGLSFDSPPFTACRNASTVLYEALAFDAWTLNPDRHHNNILVVTRTDPRAYLIDHERALLSSYRSPVDLRALADDFVDGWTMHRTAWVREDAVGTWRGGISDWSAVLSAAGRISSLSDSLIRNVINSLPEAWKDHELCTSLEYFLLKRRDHILDIITPRLESFPNLHIASKE